MRETLVHLDTFYVTNYVSLMMKWVYCHMYQGNSQGSGKLNNYSTDNSQCFYVPEAWVISKQAEK